jgi:hypothetical protein
MALSRGKLLLQLSLQKQSKRSELTDDNNNFSDYTINDEECIDSSKDCFQLPADFEVENVADKSELKADNNYIDAECKDSAENCRQLPAQDANVENVGKVINQGLSVLSSFEYADSQLQDVSQLIATALEEEKFYDFDDTLYDPDYELQGDSGDSSSDNSDVIDHEEPECKL